MANNNFNAAEMLKVAILMEDEGYKFYTNGANYTKGKIKQFLISAAGQEFVHKEKFRKLFDEVSNKKDTDSDYLFDEEVTAHLKNLIENKVFNQKEQPEDAFADLKTAIEHAVKTEELTVDVYSQLYKGISKKEVKDILSLIIEEEKGHAAYFSKLLKEIV
ncbi:MAG: ferritin-like domain-containing protein [Clostridium sp.]|jgi:rubrerythrin|uniref:ferritin family protein n=1 Tax=Clostridium sp. TaxID=1506 RepID=UPI0025C531A1|nr:ferritin family protein [Clostridium sp.]MCH3964431.1 ferritin-like domain-containing protein [Clostridium sp.]MCI1715606.1 ferritin-like domain-containing protein [Clostridium sp.]MCI1799602.1 ferritin-like domain-containing protein [Clostridium sp.]MCI1813790.1 ferritin-like domain-containing protein [Clostridium sp.]MCI1870415.1 ferritin-like domain-containing protein [Clostridium sp.]